MIWCGPRQINVRVPAAVQPGSIDVVVEAGGRSSYPESLEVMP
jgi:uncharacterized protein (TIGR03437 family)